MLQHFTRDDMKNYKESMLLENDKFKFLAAKDHRCSALRLEISQIANGIWLWVFLVVRDITARETYDTLEKRLNSLPRELNAYFVRIIDRMIRSSTQIQPVSFSLPLSLYGLFHFFT